MGSDEALGEQVLLVVSAHEHDTTFIMSSFMVCACQRVAWSGQGQSHERSHVVFVTMNGNAHRIRM